MAVPPPTGPFPPNDGSNIFRRGVPKPTAKPVPPADDPTPEEPAEVLELDDEDALFGSEVPSSSVNDLDAQLSGVMLADPTDEPRATAGQLEDALADPRPPSPPSAADSSIFTGGSLPPTGVGSGWLDPSASAVRGGEPASGDLWTGTLPADLPPPAGPPSTDKYEDAADLFADLRDDTPPSDSVWVEDEGDPAESTGRVSESEVRRVLDTARPEAGESPDLHDTPASMADFELGDAELVGGKGDAVEFDDRLADPTVGGSSIFDKLDAADTAAITAADDIDFNIPVPTDPNQASSMSGRLPGDIHDDPEAVAADLFGGDATTPEVLAAEPADATDDRSPALAAAVAAGVLGGVGAAAAPPAKKASAKVPPPPRRPRPADEDDAGDDRPAPKAAAKRGGVGGALAGLATGLALGVGGFALVYLAGLIPNEKKGSAAVAPVGPADPQQAAKLQELTDKLKEAGEKADQASADLRQERAGAVKWRTQLDEANNKLADADAALAAARTDAADAKKAVEAAKKEASDAAAALDPVKKEAEAAKKELATARKDAADAKAAVDAAKKQATDAAKERDDAKAALDVLKKDAADALKLAADADAKRGDAEKRLKAADDSLAGVVKGLKASKLLGDADDVGKLPEGLRKLAAVTAGGDAQKAAEMVLAAQKERDAAKAALAKAEGEAKALADRAAADARKAADEKLKASAEVALAAQKERDAAKLALTRAEAEAKKARDDLTAAKAAAKAEAEAAVKAQLDAAVAKLKATEAEFAARLADARAGGVKVVPAEMEAGERAGRSYADGLAAYRGGRYAAAEAAFAAATQTNPADARYWYYLGLARTRAGTAGADEAFQKGGQMERLNKPSGREVDAALERLTFTDKQRVNQYR